MFIQRVVLWLPSIQSQFLTTSELCVFGVYPPSTAFGLEAALSQMSCSPTRASEGVHRGLHRLCQPAPSSHSPSWSQGTWNNLSQWKLLLLRFWILSRVKYRLKICGGLSIPKRSLWRDGLRVTMALILLLVPGLVFRLSSNSVFFQVLLTLARDRFCYL